MKNIFEYTSYRVFLQDFYESRKKSAERFSLRRFASMAGFHSAGFLKMILEGKRNLSHDSIRRLAQGLGFNKDETQFFTNLVLLNQSSGIDEKKYYAEQLLKSRSYKKLHPFKPAQYDFYTQWFCIVVRELVDSKGFVEDPAWIAAAVEPPISVKEAERAVETLLDLKMVKRDSSGKLTRTEQSLTTGDDVDSASVADFHRAMLQRAAESLDRIPYTERDISALTFGAGPETSQRVMELVRRFRKELAAIIMASEEEVIDVYELGLQVFPLSRTERARKKAERRKPS